MEEKRNWWEEGLCMAGANFGEVVEEKSSAAEQQNPVGTCGCICVRVLYSSFSGCSHLEAQSCIHNHYQLTKTESVSVIKESVWNHHV